MNRFSRNSLALLGALIGFTLIVRSQLPNPPAPPEVGLPAPPDPIIVLSGKIPSDTNYTIRVSYWTTSESFFCTDFNFGSLLPFGFGNNRSRNHKNKVFIHDVETRQGFHHAKIPIDSITGPCGWKPMYMDLCLTKNGLSTGDCIKLLRDDYDDGSLRGPLPLAQGQDVNIECEPQQWYEDNRKYEYQQCYRAPIEQSTRFNLVDYMLNYNYSLVPQEITLNIIFLTPEEAKKRRGFILDAYTKSYGPGS